MKHARALVLGAAVLCGVVSAVARTQPLGPLDDETLLLPIAFRATGAASYAGDSWLEAVAPVFSVPYSWIAGFVAGGSDRPMVALSLLALPFHVAFYAGTALLAMRLASARAGVCTLILSGGGVLAVGGALPRDLVFCLLPWFVLGSERFADRPRAAGLLFFGLGVAANLHPLTALHALIWLLGIELVLAPTPATLRNACLRGAAFAAGAAPYVWQYLSLPRRPGAVDETVYAWRLGSMAGETWGPWTTRMESLLWLALAGAVAVLAVRRTDRPAPPRLVAGAAIAVVLAAAGPWLGEVVRPLRSVQLDRFARLAIWDIVVLLAVTMFGERGGRLWLRVASGIAFGMAIVSSFLVVRGTDRGPLGRLGRKIDRDRGIPYELPRPEGLAVRRTDDLLDWESQAEFQAVCRFARETSPPDALFLVPPENWGAFRVYARRGVVVTRKEGGAALSFLGAAGMDWYRDYAAALDAYATRDGDTLDGFARAHGATFLVLDDAETRPARPPVFEAPPYRVYAVPPK